MKRPGLFGLGILEEWIEITVAIMATGILIEHAILFLWRSV